MKPALATLFLILAACCLPAGGQVLDSLQAVKSRGIGSVVPLKVTTTNPVKAAVKKLGAVKDSGAAFFSKKGLLKARTDSLKPAGAVSRPSSGTVPLKTPYNDSLKDKFTSFNLDSLAPGSKLSVRSVLLAQLAVLKSKVSEPKALLKGQGIKMVGKPVTRSARLTSADISNTLTTTPVASRDSSETILQNTLQENFSFSVRDKYNFSGYLLYRKTITGPLPDFFDFHLAYSGTVPPAKVPGPPAGKDILRRLYSQHNVFDSVLGRLEERANGLKGYTSASGLQGEVIAARETVANYQVDSSYRYVDSSSLAAARELLGWYSGFEKTVSALDSQADSIRLCRDQFTAILYNSGSLQDIVSKCASTTYLGGKFTDSLKSLRDARAGRPVQGAITKLGIGRVFPYQSELTLKNNSLRGADLKYEYGRYIVGASAGLIDFQLNGLLRTRKMERPLPYVAVFYAGYRLLPRVTAGLRYFNGRKDNYAAGIRRPSVQGTAFELAYAGNGRTVSVEVAKNISQPSFTAGVVPGKSFWDVSDRENMAVSVRSSFFIRRTRTNIDASYAAQGKYYNAFNSYASNTQTRKYDVKVSQSLWSGMVRVTGWVRNTEYTPSLNGIVLQNDVSLKSLNVSFRKAGWPLLSLGYNPIKQTFINDSAVQVAIYQALSLFGAYNYKLGIRPASVSLVLNRLGSREASGAGQTYLGNSVNVMLDHRIDFAGYSSLINVAYIRSAGFLLITAGSGLTVNVGGGAALKAGITINSFNHTASKAGGSLGFQAALGNRGAAGIDYNLSYLPSVSGKSLARYNYGNLSIRYTIIK